MPSDWIPIENNPDVLNSYLFNLGANAANAEFVDVYGVAEDLLAMVPTPVYAVLLVYPITSVSEAKARAMTDAQKDEVAQFLKANRLFYTKQYTANACGTIAVLHAVLNNVEHMGPFEDNSALALLYQAVLESKGDPAAIGAVIRDAPRLAVAHSDASVQGATSVPSEDAPVYLHFVCFVHVGSRCVELDGRQANPILHAVCASNSEFLTAVGSAISQKMADDPESVEFSITALVGRSE